MKNKTLKYILIAIAVATALIVYSPDANERPVTHMVTNNPAERHAKR